MNDTCLEEADDVASYLTYIHAMGDFYERHAHGLDLCGPTGYRCCSSRDAASVAIFGNVCYSKVKAPAPAVLRQILCRVHIHDAPDDQMPTSALIAVVLGSM